MTFSAVILAGGKSSRMGRDKAWLEVAGETLLARQIKLARAAGATEVFLSGRANQDYSRFEIPVVRDHFPDCGPLAGIESALRVCREAQLLVLAVDMPRFTVDLLQELRAQCEAGRGIIPRCGGQLEPLAAFYPQAAGRLAGELLAAARARVGMAAPGAAFFATHCVNEGLARFYDLSETAADYFVSWNQPQDVAESICPPGPVV